MGKKQVSKTVLLKSSFWYTVSNYLTRAMVFFTMPIFTRLMTKDQYGDFSVFANLQIVLLIICGLESYNTINRARFDFTSEGELDEYITSSLVLSFVFTGLLLIIYCTFTDTLKELFMLDSKYIYIMFAYLLFCPSFLMFQAKQRIEYQYVLCSGLSFFVSIFAAISSVALAIYMPSDRLMGRILGQYVPYTVLGLASLVYFIYCKNSISIKACKYSIRMGLPMVFGFLGNQILLSSDSFVVKQLDTAESVSYLSVTYTCGQIIMLLVQTLNGAWAPWFYDRLRINDIINIRNIYIIYIWGVVILTFITIVIGPEIVLFLGGTAYMEALDILPAYALCGVFMALTAQFSNLESYYKKPEYTAILTIIAAVLNVALNIIGIKIIGYKAVCYATVICQIVLIFLHYYITMKMDICKLLPAKDLLYILFVSMSFIPIALLIYNTNGIRYAGICLIVIFLIVCILKNRDIYCLLKNRLS